MPTIPIVIPSAPVYPARGVAAAQPIAGVPVYTEQQPGTRSGLIWLALLVGIVSLSIIAAVLLYYLYGGQSASNAGVGNRDKSESSSTENTNTTSTTVPSPVMQEYGYVNGTMTYPSDGIPGVMVACGENIETTEIICTSKRDSWQTGVSYSLKLPQGKYYVYATILAGDASLAGMTGKRAYYTDYIRCGQAENCKSHAQIPVEVTAGESLDGIVVGDWWAQTTTQTTTTTSSSADNESNRERERAIESVRAILRKNASGCKISKIVSITAKPIANGWRVTARVVMAASGSPLTETAVWNITQKYGTQPADQLTFEIGRNCMN
jgi:hypothetical protein